MILRDSVRTRLLWLALLLLLPGLAISTLLTWRTFVTARRGAETALLATARALDQLVDREFMEAEILLRTLAATDSLRQDRLDDFARLARATALPDAAIVLVDSAGQILVDTGQPDGASPRRMPLAGWAGETVGRAFIASLVAQRAAGVLSARVVLPIGVDGRHAYDLELVLPASTMQALLNHEPLPSGWVSAILDPAATLVARTRDPQLYIGRRAGPVLRDELARRDEGVVDGRTFDGTPVVTAFTRSQLGWTVVVNAPRALIAQAGWQSTQLLVLLGSGAILVGLLGALRVAGGIARPIEHLAASARLLGDGGDPAWVSPGMAEADAVAQAMAAAAGTLAERRDALGALNAGLADRVAERTAELGQANAALDDQRRQLRDMLDHMPVGVAVHLSDGRLHLINLEGRRLLRLALEGPVEQAPYVTMQRGVVVAPSQMPWARAACGIHVDRELLTLHFVPPLEGQPPLELEVSASPLLDAAGHVVMALTTMADVTARLEAEEARRRSQRLEAVGQLTGGVAHEFNNLLMAVSGCLELLAPHVEGAFGRDSRPLGLLANATRAAQRGAGLTGQLLAFSRRQTLVVEPVDLNGLITGMTQLLEGTLGRLIDVEMAPDPEAWPALADAAQLELVLLNLAINARDAMPGGGRIVIRTGRAKAGMPSCAEDPPEGEYATLQVADTGHGMPPQVLARAFEPFFTTKDVGRGSGLGLPQVLGVAQQLGGGVAIASEPERGTTVTLFLPRFLPSESGPDDLPAPLDTPGRAPMPDAGRLTGARLLLVDDDADVRHATRSMLDELGAEVQEAASAAAALLLLRTTPFDLVLTDITMPQMTGSELAREVARLLPEMPIVLMTGYGAAAVESPAPNVWTTLQKPFHAETLAAVLCLAVAQRERP